MNRIISGKRKRILITGASGFLGRYLVSAASAMGWEVFALIHKRHLNGASLFDSKTVRLIYGDVNDLFTIQDIIPQVDAVCHLAAYIPPSYNEASYVETCLKTNSLAVLNLAQLIVKNASCRLIYLSSASAYGFSDAVVKENDPLYPADYATYYLASKLAGELFVEHMRRTSNLNAVCLRVSSVYGWGMLKKAVVAKFMDSACNGHAIEVWGDGANTYDFVYVLDVVGAILSAIETGDAGIYNIGSGVAHTVLDLARLVADVFSDKNARVENKPSVYIEPVHFPALAIEKANKVWGYRPLSFREGLFEYRKEMERERNDYSGI